MSLFNVTLVMIVTLVTVGNGVTKSVTDTK